MKLETTIKCSQESCMGCLNGQSNKEGIVVLVCNECGVEGGRGVIEPIDLVLFKDYSYQILSHKRLREQENNSDWLITLENILS